MLFAFIELADVCSAWLARSAPRLYAIPVLHVVVPIALVLSLAIHINEYSKAVSLVLSPLPLVYVPVRVCDAPLAVGFTPEPHAFEFGAIRPVLDANALSLTCLLAPLALVLLAAAHIFQFVYINPELARV